MSDEVKVIPLHSVVIMVGPSGAGKSTLVDKHFSSYEVVSSDALRHELVGDFHRQDLNMEVMNELAHRAQLKYELGERVVLDATHLRQKDRLASVEINDAANTFYMVWDRPLQEKMKTSGWRRTVVSKGGKTLVERHDDKFKSTEKDVLNGDDVGVSVIDARTDGFVVVRKPDFSNMSKWIEDWGRERGKPFTGIAVIGDVHNEYTKMKAAVDHALENDLYIIFLGDIIDYGPDPVGVVNEVYDIITTGKGTMVWGNHEKKIKKYLDQMAEAEAEGYPRHIDSISMFLGHGNAATTDVIEALPAPLRQDWERKFRTILNLSPHHLSVNNVLLVHGAFHENLLGKDKNSFRLKGESEPRAMYGQGQGEDDAYINPDDGIVYYGRTHTDEDGNTFPVRRYDWTDEIPKHQTVLVGHDYSRSVDGRPFAYTNDKGGNVLFVDTGCGKGGALTMVVLPFGRNSMMKISEVLQFSE